jgi:pyruvate ferredoxin oxidoreductase gamma subunit
MNNHDTMGELTEVRWHGRGGQGVVTASKLLAVIALDSGRYFQAFPDYGPERMGAPIRAYTRLSSQPIRVHCQIQEPDIVVVLDPTLLGTVDVTEGLKEGGMLLVNTHQSPAEIRQAVGLRGGQVRTVNASQIALQEMGRDVTNTPMLGAFAHATGLFGLDEMAGELRAWFGGKLSEAGVEGNLRAMRRAAEELQEG